MDLQFGIADIGYQRSQRIGVCAVLVVQHPLDILTGHDSHHHLGLQLIVGSQLAGDGFFDLTNLLVGQILLEVHFIGGVDIQLGDVLLGVRIAEGHLTGAVVMALHRHNFRKEHVTGQIAALPGVDGGFIPIDFAVVEYNNLLRLEIDLAVHDQLAGNDVTLGVMILEHIIYGAILGIIGFILHSRFVHGGVIGHVIPQSVGQSLGKLDDLDLLAEDAHRQRVDIFRISGKLHAVLGIQGKGGAGSEARLAVNFGAGPGFAHGDFRGLQAGAKFNRDVVQRFGCGHALRQYQSDGRGAVGKLELSDGAGVFPHLLLIGGIHGVKGHALLNGIGISEGRGAFLVNAPAAKGIAFFGGVQAFHRLGQKILTLGKHHGLQLTASEGFKGDDGCLGFIDEPGIQSHLSVHGIQAGHGSGIFRILIPCGEDLALQRGIGLGEIQHTTGRDLLSLNRGALGNKGYEPFVQHEIHLLTGLQPDNLGVGAGHFEGFIRFIDHRAGGANGQRTHSLLHTNHAKRTAALDKYFVGALDNNLGKLRAGIHMEVDYVGLSFLARLSFLLYRSIADMYTGNFALAQIDAARSIQGERLSLDSGQGQLLGSRNRQSLRQECGDREVIAQNGDVAQIRHAQQAVNGCLGIDHSRECRFHQMNIFIRGNSRRRVNLLRFFGQISGLCQDCQIDAVILQAQMGDPIRIRLQINVCRVFDNKAQHAGNLLARFRPCDLLCEGKHIA